MERIATKDDVVILRFDRGEEVLSALHTFCHSEGIEGAFFYGLGGAAEVTLSRYVLDKGEYESKSYNGDLEIASLVGNVAEKEDGEEIMIHAHATIGLDDLTAVAGHVEKIVVAGTCELRLEIWREGLGRTKDNATGLSLLSPAGE